MDTLQDRLRSLADSAHLPSAVRTAASQLLMQLLAGTVPSMARVRALETAAESATRPPKVCTKQGPGNACAWLRKYGSEYSLRVPPIGEPAICQYIGNQVTCPGYKP